MQIARYILSIFLIFGIITSNCQAADRSNGSRQYAKNYSIKGYSKKSSNRKSNNKKVKKDRATHHKAERNKSAKVKTTQSSYNYQAGDYKNDTVEFEVAQQENTPFAENNILHENILQLSGGWSKTHDMYLSPLVYTGFQHNLSNEWWQMLRKNDNFGHVGRVEVTYGKQRNNAHSSDAYLSSNGLQYLSVEGGWGFFSKHSSQYLQLMVGPYIGANINVKQIYSSYNKPVSADVAADLSLMFSIGTTLQAKKTSYRLRYLAYLNVIGAQFLPDFWQSYYELEKDWAKHIRFSYIGARINLRHEISLDMQLPHTTWRVAVRHEYIDYGTNDMRIKNENISIVLGALFNYKIDGKLRFTK